MTKLFNPPFGPNDNLILQDIIQGLYDKKPLSGPDGMITQLFKNAYDAAYQGEIDAHLHNQGLEEAPNRRNGTSKKMIKPSHGSFELNTLEPVMAVLSLFWLKKDKWLLLKKLTIRYYHFLPFLPWVAATQISRSLFLTCVL